MTDEKFNLQAGEALKFLRRSLFEHIYGIKLFRDNKFYTAFGYSTIEDFARDEIDLGRAQLYYYLRIADKFLPGAFDSEVHLSGLFSLGVSKLKVLSGLEDQHISSLKNNGEITIEDITYKIKDLKKITVDQLKALIGYKETEPADEEKKPIDVISAYNRIVKGIDNIVIAIQACPHLQRPELMGEIQKHLTGIVELLRGDVEIAENIKKIKNK